MDIIIRYKKLTFFILGIFTFRISSFAPTIVENLYSNGTYKLISQIGSSVTGIVPFSIAEFMVFFTIAFIISKSAEIVKGIVTQRIKFTQFILKSLKNILVFLSFIYFIFVFIWGLNYHRMPFSKIIGLNIRPASTKELEKLCDNLIRRANILRDLVNEDHKGVMKIEGGYSTVFDRAYLGYKNVSQIFPELGGIYGKPKAVLLSRAMSYAGISGIYFPFTFEANVNIEIPDSMLPATTSHEMAHQRGIAREDEANYIAYITCNMHPDPDFKYSGTLLALIHSMNALFKTDRNKYYALKSKFSEGVDRDLAYINKFWQSYEGPIEDASTSLNNTYLKANDQEAGVHSYGRMVDLLIAEYRLKKKNSQASFSY
jgi:hypothetical protein